MHSTSLCRNYLAQIVLPRYFTLILVLDDFMLHFQHNTYTRDDLSAFRSRSNLLSEHGADLRYVLCYFERFSHPRKHFDDERLRVPNLSINHQCYKGLLEQYMAKIDGDTTWSEI